MEPGVRFLPSPGAAKEPNYNVNATADFWVPVAPDPKIHEGARSESGGAAAGRNELLGCWVPVCHAAGVDHLEAVRYEYNRAGRNA
jgi:hypothetical protein